MNYSAFHQRLNSWFEKNKRPLPWRNTRDWYPVFLSEILLQQTQVKQGLPYFHTFMKHYPDIYSLAKADEQDILTLWSGLGYYSRARNLLKCAQTIVRQYQGVFPLSEKEALKLPGIGPYTAAAVLSLAFNQPLTVVDGNVMRVIARLFNIHDDLRQSSTKHQIDRLANQLLNTEHPAIHNEAMMELGSLVCKPINPVCAECPISSFCEAFEQGTIQKIPFKSPPAEKRKIAQYVIILRNNRHFLLVRRPSKGLLANMWEFPVIEVERLDQDAGIIEQIIRTRWNIEMQIAEYGNALTHAYSHIHLDYKPLLVDTAEMVHDLPGHETIRWLSATDFHTLPMHNAHKKIFLKSNKDWFNN